MYCPHTCTLQFPEKVTEVEEAVASGDLPSEPAEGDTSKPPSQQQEQQNGGGGGGGGGVEGSTSSTLVGVEDCAGAPSPPDVPPTTASACSPFTKAPFKRPSPTQTEGGKEGEVSCKRAKQEECEGAEEGEYQCDCGGVMQPGEDGGS